MHLFLHLKNFHIYHLILFFIFCIIVNSNYSLYYFNYSLYCIFHFLLLYLSLYNYRKILYIIYFFYGLGMDIFWLNEIGPHLFTFMLILAVVNKSRKYLTNLSAFKIYIFILFLQLLMILVEKFISYILFSNPFDSMFFLKISIISIILSYPIFILFSKIDKI